MHCRIDIGTWNSITLAPIGNRCQFVAISHESSTKVDKNDVSKQQSGEYQILFGYRNEHHMAMVRSEGNGCVIEVEAFPVSFISGIYDISIYGYSMPDGTVVSADKFVEE